MDTKYAISPAAFMLRLHDETIVIDSLSIAVAFEIPHDVLLGTIRRRERGIDDKEGTRGRFIARRGLGSSTQAGATFWFTFEGIVEAWKLSESADKDKVRESMALAFFNAAKDSTLIKLHRAAADDWRFYGVAHGYVAVSDHDIELLRKRYLEPCGVAVPDEDPNDDIPFD